MKNSARIFLFQLNGRLKVIVEEIKQMKARLHAYFLGRKFWTKTWQKKRTFCGAFKLL